MPSQHEDCRDDESTHHHEHVEEKSIITMSIDMINFLPITRVRLDVTFSDESAIIEWVCINCDKSCPFGEVSRHSNSNFEGIYTTICQDYLS